MSLRGETRERRAGSLDLGTETDGTIERTLNWRLPLIIGFGVVLASANVLLAADSIVATTRQEPWDWRILVEASRAAWRGESPYVPLYVWSPLAAYGAVALDWLGADLWRLLHIPAALAFPTWPTRLLTLASYPFWFDVNTGNILVFVALLAVYAVRGNRWAGWGFLTLGLLVPRPLMLPVMIWLLWREPSYRIGFTALTTASLAAVLATGYAADWIDVMLAPGRDMFLAYNIAPSRWMGYAWLALSLPIGAWLMVKGRLGWASLAVSPYVLPYYLLMLLLEAGPGRVSPRWRCSRRSNVGAWWWCGC